MSTDNGTVITKASQQWWNRPDDERYLTLDSLHEATLARANRSRVDIVKVEELVAEADEAPNSPIAIASPQYPVLTPTNWSFNQLCSRAHVPSKWARELGPHYGGANLATYAINYGLRMLAAKESLQVMALAGEDSEVKSVELRALTGQDYGRIYDHRVVEAVIKVNQDAGGRWHVPSASYQAKNPKRATTLYASDRDVFMFLVDERNPIEVRIPGQADPRRLYRGFMVWNSEVGSATMGIMTFLYDYVCDNRMIWGAREVKELNIRHSSGAPDRFEREATPLLARYAESSVIEVEHSLARAAELQVGKSDEEVVKWLQRKAFGKREAERAIEYAKAEEGDARTLWQIVNGGTAYARSIGKTDDRVAMERKFSGLLGSVKTEAEEQAA